MTPEDAAQWMWGWLSEHGILEQEIAVWELHERNPALTYQNDNGNLALSKEVLAAFRKITRGEDVVWSRSERHWRYRQEHDRPGRLQD